MLLIRKYVWIIETIRRYDALSLKELNEKWVESELSGGVTIPRQTFDRWKAAIVDLFGIIIECNLKDGYRYYIYNPEVLEEGELSGWLLDSFSTFNTLSQGIALKERILVEEVPSSREHLEQLITAMKSNYRITITYKGFQKSEAATFPVEPYALKLFQKRWYLLAHSVNDKSLRLYAVDRIINLEESTTQFKLPEEFDAKEYFSSFFGIVLDHEVGEERILLKADRYHQHYLRTLPLHHSQREVEATEEYAYFELHLRPTYDFVMELLKVGAKIEVIEPASLRQQLQTWSNKLWELYNKKSYFKSPDY